MDPEELVSAVGEEVGKVLVGNEDKVRNLTVALLTGGHVLLEGVPGVAKTTIANLFATATGLSFNRVQMTPDLLPADVTGTHVYRWETGEFVLQKGPVFENLVVADEINRATAKTQSALLEAMQEGRVTIEGETMDLPEPFMVVATQNPIEMEGTYELPEAQKDRFLFKLTIDLPDRGTELGILDRFDGSPDLGPENIDKVVGPGDVLEARKHVEKVYVDSEVKTYVQELMEATRRDPDVEVGGSPRASISLMHASKALAAIDGRGYVVPDDVKGLLDYLLRHRLVLGVDAELGGVSVKGVVERAKSSVRPPGSPEEGFAEAAKTRG